MKINYEIINHFGFQVTSQLTLSLGQTAIAVVSFKVSNLQLEKA